MESTVVTDSTETNDMSSTMETRLPIERLAWMIMLFGFGLFCSSSIALSAGAYYFFFQSTVPMASAVQAAQGTAVVVDSNLNETSIKSNGERSRLPIARQATISTDTQSQAVLTFKVPDDSGQFVDMATVTLQRSTETQLLRATRPRFDWSDGYYGIDLQGVRGEMTVYTHNNTDRAFRMQIHTPHGNIAVFDEPGRYTLTISSSEVRLASQHGQAILIPQQGNNVNNRLVTTGQEAVYIAGRDVPAMNPYAPKNLLENSLFAYKIPTLASQADEPRFPLYWGCTRQYDSPPPGDFTPAVWDGRPAMRLLRDGASSHGETICMQEFTALQGLDVSAYSQLELETTFLIDQQSLSECGSQGSECPLMLKIEYDDIYGTENVEWFRGFYYNYDPVYDSWPSRCESCLQDHTRISQDVWYTFETGNLREVLPTPPQTINRIYFYASGHDYDVYVSDIALFASERSNVLPPAVAPSDSGAAVTTPEPTS